MLTMKDTAQSFSREVYRNLNIRDEVVYSVRKDGLVEGHVLTIIMDGSTRYPIKFAVGPKGNQRVRDEQRKNVHAVIRGHMVNAVWYYGDMDEAELAHARDTCDYFREDFKSPTIDGYEWKEVTYNPYKNRTFVTVEDEQPVMTARKVVVGKEVWAMIPTEAMHEKN